MTTATDIIDCDGIYEVHPLVAGGYGVVNSESGEVRSHHQSQAEAVKIARRLNIAAWIESVDEQHTQPADIADELAAAWPVVFGRELATENDDVRRDAWSHLCAAVL